MVRSFAHRAEEMKVPRTLVVNHPLGRPLGAAHDSQRQNAVLAAAFDLLESATANGTIAEFPEVCRPNPKPPSSG